MRKAAEYQGSTPDPEYPHAPPGSFLVVGKAWFDEDGTMLIDQDGELANDEIIEEDFVLRGTFLHEITSYGKNGRKNVRATPSYELRWCPVARKPRGPRKR